MGSKDEEFITELDFILSDKTDQWHAIEASLDKTWILIPKWNPDGTGEGWYIKEIFDATSEEFLDWAYYVLPLPYENKQSMLTTLNNPESRALVWENIFKAHATRFLFGAGYQTSEFKN